MTVQLRYVNITVNDVDAALDFYSSVFGLESRNDVANGGFRWVTLGTAEQALPELVLSEPGAGRSPENADALQELLVKGELPMLVFRTDDVDATFERAVAAGAEVMQEPMDQGWGPRDCGFRDPSGNSVRVEQAPA